MVLTIGTIHGGRRFNIIADEVKLEGTLRALDPAIRERAIALVRETLAGITAAYGARYTLELDDAAAPLINDEQLTPPTRSALARIGTVVEARPQWSPKISPPTAQSLRASFGFSACATKPAASPPQTTRPNSTSTKPRSPSV
jgi:amidohydrolase